MKKCIASLLICMLFLLCSCSFKQEQPEPFADIRAGMTREQIHEAYAGLDIEERDGGNDLINGITAFDLDGSILVMYDTEGVVERFGWIVRYSFDTTDFMTAATNRQGIEDRIIEAYTEIFGEPEEGQYLGYPARIWVGNGGSYRFQAELLSDGKYTETQEEIGTSPAGSLYMPRLEREVFDWYTDISIWFWPE